jgi:hypothetical protein
MKNIGQEIKKYDWQKSRSYEEMVRFTEYLLEYTLNDFEKEELLCFLKKGTSVFHAVYDVNGLRNTRADNFRMSITTNPELGSFDERKGKATTGFRSFNERTGR